MRYITKIKTFFLAGAVVLSALAFAGPLPAYAADDCDKLEAQIKALDKEAAVGGTEVNPLQGLPRTCTVNALSYSIIRIFLYAAGGIAVVFIMVGGFQYMMGMSSGGDEAIAKAKKTITYAVIGLVIVVLAGTIVTMLYNLITNNTTTTSSTTGGGGNGGNTGDCPPGSTAFQCQGGGTGKPITYLLSIDDTSADGKLHFNAFISASTDDVKKLCGNSTTTTTAQGFLNGAQKGSSKQLPGSVTLDIPTDSPSSADPNSFQVSVKVCGKTINEET